MTAAEALPLTGAALLREFRESGLAAEAIGDETVTIDAVVVDSRKAGPGVAFAALPGTHTDGTRFVAAAVAAGSPCAIVPSSLGRSDARLTLCVDDPARAAGIGAAAALGHPSRALTVVGVTGTNGKTSTCYLLEAIFVAAGHCPGVVGTVESRWPGVCEPATMTTPPADLLQSLLARMRKAGCDAVAMEVSSHALDQKRVAGCRFAAAVFTNLSRDHLDYHADEESYFAAKAALFRDYLEGGAAIVNVDDGSGRRLADELSRGPGAPRLWTVSLDPGSDARARVLSSSSGLDGLAATVDLDGRTLALRSPLVGRVNLYNLLVAAAAAAALDIDHSAIAAGIAGLGAVPGRLERVSDARPVVLVDYAHTPDALERVLEFLRPETPGRLFCVFGCGGDRDRGKRPMMGEIAARLADVAVVTSDNPRTEDPQAIVAQVLEGMGQRQVAESFAEVRAANGGTVVVEVDRRKAIADAVSAAADDDVVLIAGKGHEDYQDIAGTKHPFDDRVEARAALGTRA